MATKVLLIPVLIGGLTLAGCGNNDQQTPQTAHSSAASTSTPATPEVTTAVAEDKITPLSSDVVAAAQWTGAVCSLDTVDGDYSKDQVKLTIGKPHVFRGWLLNAAKHPAGQFSLVLKGQENFEIPAQTGVARADVGTFFKDPALSDAGFNFSSTLAQVQAGEYHVIYTIKNFGHTYFCDTGKTLTIE